MRRREQGRGIRAPVGAHRSKLRCAYHVKNCVENYRPFFLAAFFLADFIVGFFFAAFRADELTADFRGGDLLLPALRFAFGLPTADFLAAGLRLAFFALAMPIS